MAQGRSTEIITMIKWIRTRRLSIKELSLSGIGMCDSRSERHLFIANLLVRIFFIVEIIWWASLAPWEFEFLFPDSWRQVVLVVIKVSLSHRSC